MSMPSLVRNASNGVSATMDWPTMVCFEAAAEEGGMDFHLLRLEAGSLRRHGTVHGLRLGARPDAAMVVLKVDHYVERLHRSMRQVGHLVFGADRLMGVVETLSHIAILARHQAGVLGQFQIFGAHFRRGKGST